MNNIAGIDNQAILQELNQRTGADEDDNGQTDFLQLLVAQLENQDPLNPQDGGEFLSQLAQFSTVEGIENLNSSFDSFAATQVSNAVLQATALVGRSVQVDTNIGQLNTGSPLTGTVGLPASTSQLNLSILNENGALVREISLGGHPSGPVNFSWDGFDSQGLPVPPGRYQVIAEANIGGETEQVGVRINANVDSVTLGAAGDVILNLEGGLGSVPLNQVSEIY